MAKQPRTSVEWTPINEASLSKAMRAELETARNHAKEMIAAQGRFEALFLKATEAQGFTAQTTKFGYRFGKVAFARVEEEERKGPANAFSLGS